MRWRARRCFAAKRVAGSNPCWEPFSVEFAGLPRVSVWVYSGRSGLVPQSKESWGGVHASPPPFPPVPPDISRLCNVWMDISGYE